MKQLLLSVAVVAATFTARSQYFEHRYGIPASVERTGSGQFTTHTGKGHIISAHRVRTPANELILVRTEQNGRIVPGPYFKNRYFLADQFGVQCNVQSTRVAEFSNATYGVVGVAETFNPNQQHVYYASFDATGAPLFSNFYDIISGAVSYQVNAIRESDSGTDLYICGMTFDGIQHYATVLKIDVASGTLNWGFSYLVDGTVLSGEPEEAFDLIENQVTGELLVVGRRHVCATTSDDGYVLHLDPATGNVVAATNFYGNASDADSFQSIERSAGSINGYYVSGWNASASGIKDHWVVSIDNSNTLVWSNSIDYNNWSGLGTGIDNYGIDLLERVDYSGVPYIYAMGKTDDGETGQDDIEIYKIDPAGGFVLDQFTEGNFRNDDPSNIHYYSTGSVEDGLAVYSTREHPFSNFDIMLHKTYFNGVMAPGPGASCDYDVYPATFTSGPGWLYDAPSSTIKKFSTTPASVSYIDTLLDQEICHANSVTGGSNALQQNNMGSTVEVTITQTNDQQALMQVTADMEQRMAITLRDAKGSLVRSYGTTTVNQGSNQIPIDLSGLQLTTGVYFVLWNNGAETGTQKLLVQ